MGIGFLKFNFLRFVGVMVELRGLWFKYGKFFDMWCCWFKVRYDIFLLRFLEVIVFVWYDVMIR